MLKRLRVKFVCILMTVVVGMLCVIFGLIIHFSGLAMEEQSLRLMQAVASAAHLPPHPPVGRDAQQNLAGEQAGVCQRVHSPGPTVRGVPCRV